MLRSLGFGLGLETFAKFFKGFGFEKFGLGKKVLVSVSEKFGLRKKVSVLVSEKFGLGKKSRFRKIWSRKKSIGFGFGKIGSRKKVSVSVSKKFGLGKKVSVSVSENLVSEKKKSK